MRKTLGQMAAFLLTMGCHVADAPYTVDEVLEGKFTGGLDLKFDVYVPGALGSFTLAQPAKVSLARGTIDIAGATYFAERVINQTTFDGFVDESTEVAVYKSSTAKLPLIQYIRNSSDIYSAFTHPENPDRFVVAVGFRQSELEVPDNLLVPWSREFRANADTSIEYQSLDLMGLDFEPVRIERSTRVQGNQTVNIISYQLESRTVSEEYIDGWDDLIGLMLFGHDGSLRQRLVPEGTQPPELAEKNGLAPESTST